MRPATSAPDAGAEDDLDAGDVDAQRGAGEAAEDDGEAEDDEVGGSGGQDLRADLRGAALDRRLRAGELQDAAAAAKLGRAGEAAPRLMPSL